MLRQGVAELARNIIERDFLRLQGELDRNIDQLVAEAAQRGMASSGPTLAQIRDRYVKEIEKRAAVIWHGLRKVIEIVKVPFSDELPADLKREVGSNLRPITSALIEELQKRAESMNLADVAAGRSIVQDGSLYRATEHVLESIENEIDLCLLSLRNYAEEKRMAVESFADMQRKRSQFLRLLWEKAKGDESASIDTEPLGNELGLTPEQTSSIVQYLRGEGLLKIVAYGTVSITHEGTRRVEADLSQTEFGIQTSSRGEKESKMDIILSWSGPLSKKVAEELYDWLKEVLPGTKPWISSEDIAKGTKWFSSLMNQLEVTRTCIICVTPQNVTSPWIHYEAGAIAGKNENAIIVPYLIGINPTVLADGPLSQFQCTQAEKEDTWRLIRDINKSLASSDHNETVLQGNFNQKWPRLNRALQKHLTEYQELPTKAQEQPPSTEIPNAIPPLSPEARQLLIGASQDPHGSILAHTTISGFVVRANGIQFVEENNPRSEALWKSAIRQLSRYDLLQQEDDKGQVLSVSAEGYRVADLLRQPSSDHTIALSLTESADREHEQKPNEGAESATSIISNQPEGHEQI